MCFIYVRLAATLLQVLISTSSAQDFENISDFITNVGQNDLLQVYAFPVGQGDCTIISCPTTNKVIVFDCGSTTRSSVNKVDPGWIESWLMNNHMIDHVKAIIITHPDEDHYNYLHKIRWNSKNIEAVIIGDKLNSYGKNDNSDIRNWLKGWHIDKKLYTIGTATVSQGKCIGDCVVHRDNFILENDEIKDEINFCHYNPNIIKFRILAANVGDSDNQKSVVMKITVNKWSMLLSGDMEGMASYEIAQKLGTDLESKVYQMSHHGASNLANSYTWLNCIQPSVAFASSAFNYGKCRHPRCDTICRLLNLHTITETCTLDNHQIYCGNPMLKHDKSAKPTIFHNFKYNIWETSPGPNTICMLTFGSSNSFKQHCHSCASDNTTINDEYDDDQDCDDEDYDNEGSLVDGDCDAEAEKCLNA